VKDAQGAPGYGRTNWRRFGLIAIAPTVVAVGLMAGVASGAVPASFVVSGTSFKLSADKLVGTGFTQYSGTLQTNGNNKVTGTPALPAAKSGIHSADIYNMCQTVKVGPAILRIEAGKDPDNPAHADDLLIGMTELRGDTTFDHIDIGQDAATLKKDGLEEHGEVGGFGQQADGVTIEGLQQVAYSTSASTFRLTGMSLKLYFGNGQECF
jgi:hypothetical protein